MTIVTTGRLQASEQSDRQRAAVLLKSDGTQLGVIGGVHAGLALTKTSGMGWSLDLGRAVIPAATASNGPVIATVTAAETGSFAPGDATRDRIDIIALQIDETATIPNGLPPAKVAIIQGAYPTSGAPAAPPVPAGYLGLWQETVKAGTSAGGGGWDTTLLTDLRSFLGGAPAGTSYPFLQPQGNFQFSGVCNVTPLADGRRRVDIDLSIMRINSTFAINTTKVNLLQVIPQQAVGSSNLKYIMTGWNNGNGVIQIGVKPSTGEIIVSAPGGALTWAVNDLCTANCTYYI